MDSQQIKLLYCQYGFDAKKIASSLNLQETYVREVIKEHKWEQPEVESQNLPMVSETASDDVDENSQIIQKLQSKELHKQDSLAPLAAVTEFTLLTKLCEAARNIDSSEENAHVALSALTKSYKTLMQDTVAAAALVEQTKETDGSGVNVVVQTYMQS